MAEYVNPETGEVFDKAHPEFVDVLLKMSDGASHGELTDNLRELAKAVAATGKQGTLTYVLKVKPANEFGTAVAVRDEIKLRKPEFNRETSLFYSDEDGNMTQNPFDQASLFEQITGEKQEKREDSK